MALLSIGDHAPEFSLVDETGTMRSLSAFKGSSVVVYFYPKDDTPGCTKEACMIRDVYHDFERKGVVVIGISKDTPESHLKFKAKYELPFMLLSDPSKQVIKSYGALGGIFTKRISYLINPQGIIEKVYPKVDPASHAMEILQDIA